VPGGVLGAEDRERRAGRIALPCQADVSIGDRDGDWVDAGQRLGALSTTAGSSWFILGEPARNTRSLLGRSMRSFLCRRRTK
jgi:hypothetical protein